MKAVNKKLMSKCKAREPLFSFTNRRRTGPEEKQAGDCKKL